ncbi:hypothetical protein PG985_004315 [Apiospora marii]|uniref:uncharacterized protein n=1 Tax=Apiospora marii TaxID=335849 RepID=UPI003131DE34
MILTGALAVVVGLAYSQANAYTHDVAPRSQPPGPNAKEWPTCINLVQYHAGQCCITGKPCPSPIRTEAAPSTRSTAQDHPEPCHGQYPATPTIIDTLTTNQAGEPITIAVIQGGPITSLVTLTSGPQPTSLDLSGGPVRNSVSSVSSYLASNVLPIASSWASDPNPAKATAAIVAVQNLIPQLGGLSNGLPNGKGIFDCTGSSSRATQDIATTLVQKLQDVTCGVLNILGSLEFGQQTTAPGDLAPIIQDIRDNAGKISFDLSIVMSHLGTVPPSNIQTTTVANIPAPLPPADLTSVASTTTSLPPGKGKDPGDGTSEGESSNPEKKKDPHDKEDTGKGEDPENGTDPGKENNPGKEGEPSKTKDDPEPSSTAQSSTSCTTTLSATYASVFCSVTATAVPGHGERDRRRQQSTGCSTLAYSTGTACDTLLASTTTALLSEETLCSPNNCGAVSCGLGKRFSQQLKKRGAPARDSQPELNKWSDPLNYNGDRKKFIRGEVALAVAQEANHVEHGFYNDQAFPTSNWIEFGNQVNTLAVSGLYGCTSVVVVSTKGAWASHFWEWPSFTHGDEQFEYDVIRRLHTGLGVQYLSQFGLDELRNNDNNPHGHMFDDANQPRVFVIAPRKKAYLLNGKPSNSETAGGSEFRHNSYVNRILAELRTIFPNNNELALSTIQYSIQEKWEFVDVGDGNGQQKWEPDRGDGLFNFHRGKVLVQYQPAPKACERNTNIVETEQPKAMWRMWFEGRETDIFHHADIGDRHAEWVPAEHQHLKRDEQSCSMKEAGPSSGDSTSASPLSTPASTDTASPTTASTTAPIEPPPPPPSTPKTCNLHLDEYVEDPDHKPILVEYSFYDGGDKPKHQGQFKKDWNQEYLVPTSETGLALPISVTVTDKLPPGALDPKCPSVEEAGCDRTLWRSWVVHLKYGEMAWPSSYVSNLYWVDPKRLPNCQVGNWAQEDFLGGAIKSAPHRQMDCRFAC